MRDSDFDSVPIPHSLRRPLLMVAAVLGLLAVVLVAGLPAYVKLRSGWHPIPSTAIGCSLHKRFHSFDGRPVRFDNLHLAGDCLKVSTLGREEIVTDQKKIAAARAWLDARSNLWIENFLSRQEQPPPTMEIRTCGPVSASTDIYVYLNDDWLGFHPSKRFQRPLCRAEWRELAGILSPAASSR